MRKQKLFVQGPLAWVSLTVACCTLFWFLFLRKAVPDCPMRIMTVETFYNRGVRNDETGPAAPVVVATKNKPAQKRKKTGLPFQPPGDDRWFAKEVAKAKKEIQQSKNELRLIVREADQQREIRALIQERTDDEQTERGDRNDSRQ